LSSTKPPAWAWASVRVTLVSMSFTNSAVGAIVGWIWISTFAALLVPPSPSVRRKLT
jgi:hypothetical protein